MPPRFFASVHYDVNVTWNENTGQSNRDNIGNVVIAALTLAAVLFLMSVGAGAVFGFGRFYLPRFRARKAGRKPRRWRDDPAGPSLAESTRKLAASKRLGKKERGSDIFCHCSEVGSKKLSC